MYNSMPGRARSTNGASSRQQQLEVFPGEITHQRVVPADDRVGEGALGLLQLENLLLDRIAGDQPVGEDLPRLPNPVAAVDGLVHRR